MEVMLWLSTGLLIGWTASMLMRREAPRDIAFNLAVGSVGAAMGVLLLPPLLGMSAPAAAASGPVLQLAMLGAILSLAAFNLALPKSLRGLGRTDRAEGRIDGIGGHAAR